MIPRPIVPILALSLLALPGAASAEALVICHVGGPGSTAQARPVLERFLRHIERTGKLAPSSLTGEYHTTLKGCLDYIAAKRPLLAVLDLPTYLGQAKALKLSPLACMGHPDHQRYHLLVRRGSYKDLAALKGKRLISSHLGDPRFVSNVIFDGKLDVTRHFGLKPSRLPLKGLRDVARGKSDATLVDQLAFVHLKELGLPAELVSVFDSAGLPGLTMATLGTARANPATVKKVRAAIPRLCAGEGSKLCKTFQVDGFTPVEPRRYDALLKRYRR